MIIKNIRTKKALAFFFLSLLTLETLLPLHSLALTSGPVQPEHTQFAAYSTNDMVDLFTGGFKYNIPLLDVDGYPVNLNYASGAGMDDEASWVGLGWNLNVGAINRQLRGLPDDFSGDAIVTTQSTKPKITYGGRGTVRMELLGGDIAKLSGSLTLGIFSDNYTGIGAEVGANAGLSLGDVNGGMLTGNLNAGVNSNTSSGVSVTAGASLDAGLFSSQRSAISTGVAANLSYNTREGYKEMTLGRTFAVGRNSGLEGATYIYNTPAFMPKINFGYKSRNQSYSIDIGAHLYTVFAGGGLTGYKSKHEVIAGDHINPAFGYLYADRGTGQRDAMMDFMREKENPVIPALPNLAVPVSTPDVFSYSNQSGSGQFRLSRGNTAVVFDARAEDDGNNFSAGGDYGFGGYFHAGVTIYDQQITNTSGKWTRDNDFLSVSDYKADPAKPMEEQAYFKMMGEQTAGDNQFVNQLQGEKMVAVSLDDRKALAQLKDKNGTPYTPAGAYKKTGRQIRHTPVSYLTAEEAMKTTNKTYASYPLIDSPFNNRPACGPTATTFSRKDNNRKGHHITEFTVNEADGKRAVYGLPVYNTRQDEYTFAVNPAYKKAADIQRNLIGMDVAANGTDIAHEYGKDSYYQHVQQPAYATSYLLTSILSPDYVDVTNNGITEDDLGTAVKFNYSKLPGNYRWRTPMEPGKALYNRGLNADPADDKGSVIYGEKEIWYLQSIETKTKIAYFITADRDDALGVQNLSGAVDAGNKQRCLKEIHLYSKSDLTQPIKKTFFEYDYSLCPGIPNNAKGGGKLTLKKVYFTYATSTKGKYHPYTFTYNNDQGYAFLSTDRWGNLKPTGDNVKGNFGEMRNDEFPYVIQDTALANRNARQWNLSAITLPTGGAINVEYEAGDYAYVQDRKAMEMTGIQALIKDSAGARTDDLSEAHGFVVKAPGPLRGNNDAAIVQNFVTDYLNGRNDFYARLHVNVSDLNNSPVSNYYDNVSCYAAINKIRNNNDGTYNILFNDVTEGGVTANPFVMAAWQKMRLEYPMYAYPGYESRISGDEPIEGALTAIVNAIGNLSELRKNFNERARDEHFAVKMILGKSFVRMVKGNGIKIGGAARVKKIRMTDEWNTITGTAPSAAYGQQYEYRITENNQSVSSGVAAYEPYIGADENPLRMPVPYSQESRGTLTNYFYLEEPFGESLFPAPQVGYRNVIVRNLDAAGNADPQALTGWTQQEFYTAKDYPVIVEAQARPDVKKNGPSGWATFTGGSQIYELAMSQGYVIWLNDMHGKPRAERVFNQGGAVVSSNVYYYKSDPLDAGKMKLNNTVATVDEYGKINPAEVIGRDIDMVTDMREQETNDLGTSIQLGVDVIPFIFGITLPIPHWPRKDNDSYRLFRSAAILKTVQQTGILEKVVKTINGSTVTVESRVFDRNTGQPVVTSTNNEFDDPVYAVTMPAYWKYSNMSGAFKNINTVLTSLQTDGQGVVAANYAGSLTGGDELLDLSSGSGRRLWVIYSPTTNDATRKIRLIDDSGELIAGFNGNVKLYRSGFRNQTIASTATVVCKKDPVAGNRLGIFAAGDATAYKVIDAKAVLYEEEWSAKVCQCPPGYVPSADGTQCILYPVENSNDTLKLVKQPRAPIYGEDGAQFLLATSPQQWSGFTKSDFWGGSCGGGSSMLATAVARAANGPQPFSSGSMSAASSTTICGRLNETGIWLKGADYSPTDTWFGLETCFDAPVGGTYAIGYGSDNYIRLSIDGNLLVLRDNTPVANDYSVWRVIPVNLAPGKHILGLEFNNSAGTATNAGGAAVGVEIYQASPNALQTMTPLQVTNATIFGTDRLTYQGALYNTYIFGSDNRVRTARYNCNIPICNVPYACDVRSAAAALNPYLAGILGNWRVAEEKVYQVSRSDQQIFVNKGAGLNLRNSGHYTGFKPYWYYDATGVKWNTDPLNTPWITSRYVTLYDKYGQELENKDALQRYSSALFGYRGAIPVAVAANAMNREIYYDGFEDYRFNGICGANNGCQQDSFNIPFSLGTNYMNVLNGADAHTGNFSLKLTQPLNLVTALHNFQHSPGYGNYTSWNASGQYLRKLMYGTYAEGFHPVPSKKYIFSAWVKDGTAGGNKPNISVLANDVAITWEMKAVVEGWKQIEGVINVPAGASSFKLSIPAAGTSLIDDIRIFPYDATVKTYAYDDKALRLMAELDENNFATFYEYDDEGTLIRVKKETERGIMTLKETRSSMRKNN